MPRVSVLSRQQTVRFPEPGRAEEVIEVTYVSDALGIRFVALPLSSYRTATPEEMVANPRYQVLPVDPAAQDAEKKAIQEDLERAATTVPESFELP